MNAKFNKAKRICYLILGLFTAYYVFMKAPNLNPMYAEGAVFWCVLITAIIAISSFFRWGGSFSDVFVPDENGQVHVGIPEFMSFKSMGKIQKYLLMGVWGLFVVGIILSSVFLNWKAYRDQLGDPEVKTFSSDVQPVDISQIPIVDKALASKLADKKLGERPSLGSQVNLGEPTIQMVNDKLLWVVPLEHSGFFKWFTNMSGTPGYITVSATNVNDVEYVDQFKIKYHPDSYLMHSLQRHVRFTSAPLTGITDYSFELDSEGQPYWVVTTYKNQRGFALPEATGVILVNATTGESSRYTLADVPDWVDRVQPENFILQQIYNKGEYVHGFLNFSDKDKFKPSAGSNIIYNNGNCYLFTGMTSVGNDESAIGFMMVNMVTKEPILYQMNGATERSGQSSAQGKVQHLGYTASFPIILNINGEPSYFMTLKDREGLIKQYAFVSVRSYSTVGVGETIPQAMRDYATGLSQIGMSGDLTGGLQGDEKSFVGNVVRIQSQFDGDQTQYYILLEGMENKIITALSGQSAELPITQIGDSVKITYFDTVAESPLINAVTIDNLTLSIE